MKNFDEIDISLINQLMEQAMINRGFIPYSENCLKLDLHLYFEKNPIVIETQENGFPAIKVRVKMYHRNNELFISYRYKACINENGFNERHSFSVEYSYILKVIRRLLDESGVYEIIKEFK